MRVLHVGKYYPPAIGGMERIVQLMARALAARPGVEVDVLVANESAHTTEEKDGSVRVRRLATYGALRSVPVTPGMLASGRMFGDYDVVHIHSPNPLPELAWLSSSPSSALVASDWGQITRQKALLKVYGPLYRRYFAHANAVAVPSRRYAQNFDHLRDCKDRLVDVPLGIDADAWAATPEVAAKVEAVRGPKPIVLFVGRLVEFKGPHVLIEAMKAVDARLHLAGAGPERAKLEALAKAHGIADRVKFLGPLAGSDLTAAYRSADVFALPSIWPNEAFPQALLEAITCGVPAVTTELGTGTSEINRDGETGLVVPPSDVGALAGAIARLLADEGLRARMAAAAAKRARDEYSINTMTDRLLECYKFARGKAQGA